MWDKLDGWKTHISVVVLVLWTIAYLKIPGAKEAIGNDNFGTVFVALLGACGLSARAALAKVEAK